MWVDAVAVEWRGASHNDFTGILNWPGYRVYQHEIVDRGKKLTLWVRRMRGNRKIECSSCGRKFRDFYDVRRGAVRDPSLQHVSDHGVHRDLPGEVPGMWGEEGEGAAITEQGAVLESLPGGRGRGLRERLGTTSGAAVPTPASTVRAIDLRYLERWAAARRKLALRSFLRSRGCE